MADFPEASINNESLDVYKTAETVIGDWLGKTLYRKVVDFGSLPNNTTKSVAHGLTGIDELVTIRGSADDGTNYIPLPRAHSGANSVDLYVDDTNVNIGVGAVNFAAYIAKVILEYTKT